MAPEGGTRVNWPSVRLGVTLIIVSWLVMVGAFIWLAIGAVASGAIIASAFSSGRSGPRGTFMAGAIGLLAIVVLYLLGLLASMVLRIAGHVFCLSAPKKHSARTLAITALALVGSSAALYLLTFFIGMIEGGLQGLQASSPFGAGGASTGVGAGGALTRVGNIVSGLAGLLNLAGFIVFCFFLRAVALAVRAADLARSIVWFVITFISCVVVGFLGLVVMLLLVWDKFAGSFSSARRLQNTWQVPAGGSNTEPVMVLGCFIIIVGIALLAIFIWHIVILFQVRAAITRRIERRGMR